ncbi:MAG TPA: GxxExxY protein, partial [Algoriphagus sp.]|nr:GxxExxY protein [Algoriphagus sp.]
MFRVKVYNTLGPGLLESSYEAALGYELVKSGLNVEHQVGLP